MRYNSKTLFIFLMWFLELYLDRFQFSSDGFRNLNYLIKQMNLGFIFNTNLPVISKINIFSIIAELLFLMVTEFSTGFGYACILFCKMTRSTPRTEELFFEIKCESGSIS